MKCVLLFGVLLGAIVRAAGQQAAPLQADDPRRGWHFYEDPTPLAPVPAVPAQRAEGPQEIARYKALQKAVEEARIIAIMSPTVEHVHTYLELEASVLRGASRFADIARRVAWMSPDLDPSAQVRPSATFAVDVYEHQQTAQRQKQLTALSREHIVLFFFRGDCPYCHAFAPVLKAFEQRYGLQVSAVSTDGGSLPEFPHPRRDNGVSQALNIQQVPALFLAHPTSGRIIPLGFGVMSENELVERIVTSATAPLVLPISVMTK